MRYQSENSLNFEHGWYYCNDRVIYLQVIFRRVLHLQILKNVILQKGWHNVIVVDWSDSNRAPYFQAIANGRVVGAQIARLINALQVSNATTSILFNQIFLVHILVSHQNIYSKNLL